MADINQLKEQVRDANDIVDVIGSYISLKKSGSNYMGLCPFHGEKTPSFSVSPGRQMYHCFGCNKGGDVFNFVQEYENITFMEAFKLLAVKAGIEIPDNISVSRGGKDKSKEVLYSINKDAAYFFVDCLRGENGAEAREYLHRRGLDAKVVTAFGLGYAPGDGKLYRYLKDKGYSDDDLKKSGLFTYKTGVKDKFFSRVIFPILGDNREVIGFGGRVLGDGIPKYLNSPETPIFEKGENLYGFYLAKRTRNERIILVEGYMDVISMQRAGFTETVASLGTALTEFQSRKISRVAKKVYLIYDSDEAGTKAKLRAIPILRQYGITPYVVILDPYKDPDELIKVLGREEMSKRIDNAVDGVIFEIMQLEHEFNRSDPASNAEFEKEAASKIASFSSIDMDKDRAEFLSIRNNYISTVANEFHIDKNELTQIVDGMIAIKRRDGGENKTLVRKQEIHPQKDREERKSIDKGILNAEKIVLTAVSSYPGILESVEKYIRIDDLVNDVSSEVGKMLRDGILSNNLNIPKIFDAFVEKNINISIVLNSDELNQLSEEDTKKALADAIKKILQKKNEIEINKPENLAKIAELTNRKMELQELSINFD